jgi:hypothetical protein
MSDHCGHGDSDMARVNHNGIGREPDHADVRRFAAIFGRCRSLVMMLEG